MQRRVHPAPLAVTAALLMLAGTAGTAVAQPPAPGKPVVTVQDLGTGNVRVTILWTYDMNTFPDTVFGLQVMTDGVVQPQIVTVDQLSRLFPDSPSFNTQGNQIRLSLTVGTDAVARRLGVVAQNFLGVSPTSEFSDPFFLISAPPPPPGGGQPTPPTPPAPPTGPPATPVLNRPGVSGSTVTLTWSYNGPAVTRFEIIAFIQATNSTLVVPVDPRARSFSHPDAPPGNYIVRMRAVNDFGVSGLSEQFIVPVGVTLGSGDLSVTLTWNSAADIDLHVVEPNGTRVFYANRRGTTATLDRDDTDGLGPENIFVAPGQALAGVYRVYIVHFGRSVPTTSTIQITVNAGTPNERTQLITRQSSTAAPGVNIEVARVDVRAGTITPVSGISSALEEGETREPVKVTQPQ
jgi:hypothetical protein